MRLLLAFKAFWRAWTKPQEMEEFLLGKKEEKKPEASGNTHLRLLGMLQNSGRLIDFLKEDITSFSDAQVGAAVRAVHLETAKALEDLVTIRPLMEEPEGSRITIQRGYDPASIKVVGKVKGEPPFKGVLRHRGWKAHKISLPKQVGDYQREVLAPAEIEVE